MATIYRRPNGFYQATVRRIGFPTQSKTFERRREAEDWSVRIEADMTRGEHCDLSEAQSTSLYELLERYLEEVTPEKRSARQEGCRIKMLMRHPISKMRLSQLRSIDFSSYREERKKQVSGKSVREELMIFSRVFNTAKKEWSYPIQNWIEHIRKPKPNPARDRRPSQEEEQRLRAACLGCRNPQLEHAITLAIETGMRRGEIVDLEWRHIDLKNHLLKLYLTKNGDSREVPLSHAAEEALLALKCMAGDAHGKVFSYHDSDGLGIAFRRASERAGIQDLHFHDLRHEAASRLAPHMPALTLCKIMG